MKLLKALLLLCFIFGVRPPIGAQEPFYKGATIRFIVGLSAGGGYDLYSRTIARHMGKHIPGNPTVVVENMVGAGSVLSANYLYRATKPDGLTILNFLGGLFLQQLMGKPGIEFDSRKFEYLGVPGQDHFLIVVANRPGFRTSISGSHRKKRSPWAELRQVGVPTIFQRFENNHRSPRSRRFGLQGHSGNQTRF